MKLNYGKSALLLMGCLLFQEASALSSNSARLSLWGLAGSDTFGRLDALLPVQTGCDSLLYVDGQGKWSDDRDWYAGLGLGFRKIWCNQRIYGAYLFLDRDESRCHHEYWIASPGFEAITPCWDFRVNGYVPVSNHRFEDGCFFPSGENTCGLHCDCSFVEFSGHQQFEHRFLRLEEVGPGADTEIGFNLPRFNCASLHGGAYYYHMQDTSDIKGVAARIEIPVSNGFAVTSEASYDNQEHGAIVAGLRLQLGHVPKTGCCPTLCDHLYDPIYRYVGSVKRGSGIPVERVKKDQGLFLRRDDIFFFTSEGGAVFDGTLQSGTIENPLAASQLTSTVANQIHFLAKNSNLYLNSGTYIIDPGVATNPNSSLALNFGQSIYGRSEDFKCTAVGDERPLLLGTIDLVTAGNNTLDSIRLLNSFNVAVTGPLSGIDISGSQNVVLCNDDITLSESFDSTALSEDLAAVRVESNSSVLIERSNINLFYTAVNTNFSEFIGVGSPVSTNDRIIVDNSRVNINVDISGQSGLNLGVIVGAGLLSTSDYQIYGSRLSMDVNLGSSGIVNLITGVGTPGGSIVDAAFTVKSSNIDVNYSDAGTNTGTTNILGVGTGPTADQSVSYIIDNSTINVVGTVVDNVARFSVVGALGEGGNLNFDDLDIRNSLINASAVVLNDNLSRCVAVGVGGVDGTYNRCHFNLINDKIQSSVLIAGDNSGLSQANGVSIPAIVFGFNNTVNIEGCFVDVFAIVQGDNSGTNRAIGLFAADPFTIFNVDSSLIDVVARVGSGAGINEALGTDGDGLFNITNTEFKVVSN